MLLRWMDDSCCALDLMPPETILNEAGRTEFSEERWKDKSSINWHKLARSEGPYSQTSFTFELLRSLADLAEDVGFKWSASRALKKKLSVSVSIQSIEKLNINFIQIMWGMNNIILLPAYISALIIRSYSLPLHGHLLIRVPTGCALAAQLLMPDSGDCQNMFCNVHFYWFYVNWLTFRKSPGWLASPQLLSRPAEHF